MSKIQPQSLTCPVCGSDSVRTDTLERAYTLPYASAFVVPFVTNTCQACEESGDFLKLNDGTYEIAEKEAITASVGKILDDLAEQGVTMAYIERVLELPKRTIDRWKNGSDSATGIALLRLVRTCPWLLDIAKESYSPATTIRVVINQAAQFVAQALSDKPDMYFGALFSGTDLHLSLFTTKIRVHEKRVSQEQSWQYASSQNLAFKGA